MVSILHRTTGTPFTVHCSIPPALHGQDHSIHLSLPTTRIFNGQLSKQVPCTPEVIHRWTNFCRGKCLWKVSTTPWASSDMMPTLSKTVCVRSLVVHVCAFSDGITTRSRQSSSLSLFKGSLPNPTPNNLVSRRERGSKHV
jgi:hypothetical protein